jgi:hypothetical protein
MGKSKESKHGWVRYPLYVKNKYQQKKVLQIINKDIRANQKIGNENS